MCLCFRFLRTTGQRQSTYKSALPGNTANGPTTTGSGGGSGCTAGGIGSTSRRQSVANAVTNSKRKQSQAKVFKTIKGDTKRE